MAAGLNFDDWSTNRLEEKTGSALGFEGIMDSTTADLWDDFGSKGCCRKDENPGLASVAKEMAKPRVWADVFHIIYTIHFLAST